MLTLIPAPDSHPLLPITKIAPQALDLVDMVLANLTSTPTRRMYRLRLMDFLRHRTSVETGVEGLTREGVGKYLQWMETQGHGIAARNQAMSAIKLLAKEAELRGLINGDTCRGIRLIEHIKQPGVRMGNWLTSEELTRFYQLPDRTTLPGLRDGVILALLCGCALRRNEAVTITWDRYQEREGRMVLIDLMGKGNRIRTVVVPDWAERDLNNWHEEMSRYGMGGPEQRILAGMPVKWGNKRTVQDWTQFRDKISCERVWQVVKKYAVRLVEEKQSEKSEKQLENGVECSKHFVPKLSPHDLRRTLARLLYLAEADIVEIQMTLGHADINTTRKYLGAMQLKLRRGTAAVDKIKMDFKGSLKKGMKKGEQKNGTVQA